MSEKRQLSDFEKAFASARKKSGGGEGLFEWKSPKTGKVGLYSTRYKEEGLPTPKEIKAMKAKGKVIGLQESPTAGPATNAPPVVPNEVAATPATPQAAQVAERVSAPVSNDDGGSLFGPWGLTALFGGAAAALGLKAIGSIDRKFGRYKAGKAAVKTLRDKAIATGIQVGPGHIPLQLGPGRGRSSMPATPDVIVTPPPHVPKQLESGPLPAQVGASGKPLAQAKPKAPKAPKAPRASRTKGASTGALSATAAPSASAVETAIKANTTGTAGVATGQVTGGEAPTIEQIVQEAKAPKAPKTITRKKSAGTAGVTPSATAPKSATGVPQVAPAVHVMSPAEKAIKEAAAVRTNAGAAASPKVEDLSAQPGKAIGSSTDGPEPVTVRRTATANPIGPTPAATPEQQVAHRIVTEGVTAAAPAPNNPAPGSMEDALRNLRAALGTSNSPVESIIAKAAPVAEAADVIPANETESEMYDRIAREAVPPSGKAEPRSEAKAAAMHASGSNPLPSTNVLGDTRLHGSVKSIGAPETELFDLGARVGNGPVTYREKMRIHSLASKVPFKPLSEISGNLRANQQGTVSDIIREHVGQSRGEGAVVDLVRSDLGALTDPDLKRGLKQRALKDFARALDTGRTSIDSLPPEVQVAHYRLKNLELKAEREPDSIKADALFEGDDMVKARTTLADALATHDVPLTPVNDPIERARPRRDTGDVSKNLFDKFTLEKAADEILANSGASSMVDKKEKKKWGARRHAGLAKRPKPEAAKVAEVLDKGAETIEPGSLEHLTAKLRTTTEELVKGAKGSKGKGKGKVVSSILGGLMAAGMADRLNRN